MWKVWTATTDHYLSGAVTNYGRKNYIKLEQFEEDSTKKKNYSILKMILKKVSEMDLNEVSYVDSAEIIEKGESRRC